MYQENGGFDQSSSIHGVGFNQAEDTFSQTHCNFSTEEQSYPQYDVAALEMELQRQLDIEQCFTNKSGGEMVHDASNWQEMTALNAANSAADFHQIFAAKASFTDAPDLLNIFPPNFSQKSTAFSAGVVYDPLLPLNLTPQPPLLRELFHSMPHLFTNVVDEGEGNVGLYQNGAGIFEFTSMDEKNRDGIKQVSSEKHRRVKLKDKYEALRALVPNPTKVIIN